MLIWYTLSVLHGILLLRYIYIAEEWVSPGGARQRMRLTREMECVSRRHLRRKRALIRIRFACLFTPLPLSIRDKKDSINGAVFQLLVDWQAMYKSWLSQSWLGRAWGYPTVGDVNILFCLFIPLYAYGHDFNVMGNIRNNFIVNTIMIWSEWNSILWENDATASSPPQ